MKRIALVWWWNKAEEVYPYWRDGLRAAMEYIGQDHEVDILLGESHPKEDYDAVIYWGDSNGSFFEGIENVKGKKGMILTTDPQNIENLKKMDVVFCESTPVYESVRRLGIRAVKAFGTDTDFYKPDPTITKDIEYFYPATFSPWKLQHKVAYLGDKLWCVGTVQPDGETDYQACLQSGVNVAVGYFKAEYIRDLYQRAQKVIIPAIHGSERTVLEAMASGILPEVTNKKNIRTHSFIEEYEKSGLTPREFVVTHYSPEVYGKTILKALS